MDRKELDAALRELVEEETGEPCPELTPDGDLRASLNLDSMDLVSLLFRMEQRFKIKISSEKFAEVHTVNQLFDLLEAEIAAQQSSQAA